LTAEQPTYYDSFNEIFDRTVAAALGSDEVPPDEVDLIDAGLDSFGVLALMMALEDEFGGIFRLEHLVSSRRVTAIGELRHATRETLLGGGR